MQGSGGGRVDDHVDAVEQRLGVVGEPLLHPVEVGVLVGLVAVPFSVERSLVAEEERRRRPSRPAPSRRACRHRSPSPGVIPDARFSVQVTKVPSKPSLASSGGVSTAHSRSVTAAPVALRYQSSAAKPGEMFCSRKPESGRDQRVGRRDVACVPRRLDRSDDLQRRCVGRQRALRLRRHGGRRCLGGRGGGRFGGGRAGVVAVQQGERGDTDDQDQHRRHGKSDQRPSTAAGVACGGRRRESESGFRSLSCSSRRCGRGGATTTRHRWGTSPAWGLGSPNGFVRWCCGCRS